MDSPEVYAVSLDDYLITAEVLDDAISIFVELEHEVVLNLFEYPAEITVLSNKITDVERVALAATDTALAATATAEGANATANAATATATSAQSSADASMSQAEAATDMAASNTLSISNILTNFAAWVRTTLLTGLPAFSDAIISATDTVMGAFAKLQGQVNAIKGRLGVLEDSYLLKYIVPVDTLVVHLTLDKNGNPLNFIDGDSIKIIIMVPLFSIANRVNLRINNRSDNIYIWHTTLNPFSFLPPTLSNALSHYSITDLELTGGNVVFSTVYRCNTETNAISGAIGGATVGLNSGITSLYFYGSTASIPAGAIIIIKKK